MSVGNSSFGGNEDPCAAIDDDVACAKELVKRHIKSNQKWSSMLYWFEVEDTPDYFDSAEYDERDFVFILAVHVSDYVPWSGTGGTSLEYWVDVKRRIIVKELGMQ